VKISVQQLAKIFTGVFQSIYGPAKSHRARWTTREYHREVVFFIAITGAMNGDGLINKDDNSS